MRLSFNRRDEQQALADMFEPFRDSVAWLPPQLREAVEQRHTAKNSYECTSDEDE